MKSRLDVLPESLGAETTEVSDASAFSTMVAVERSSSDSKDVAFTVRMRRELQLLSQHQDVGGAQFQTNLGTDIGRRHYDGISRRIRSLSLRDKTSI
jgi:hypothetical protein